MYTEVRTIYSQGPFERQMNGEFPFKAWLFCIKTLPLWYLFEPKLINKFDTAPLLLLPDLWGEKSLQHSTRASLKYFLILLNIPPHPHFPIEISIFFGLRTAHFFFFSAFAFSPSSFSCSHILPGQKTEEIPLVSFFSLRIRIESKFEIPRFLLRSLSYSHSQYAWYTKVRTHVHPHIHGFVSHNLHIKGLQQITQVFFLLRFPFLPLTTKHSCHGHSL